MIDTNNNIKQLLLADGREVICEIMEELEEDIVIRCAFRIARIDMDVDRSYYMFKPMMTYVEKPDHYITLNLYHVVAATIPSTDIREQYESAVEKINEALEEDSLSGDEVTSIEQLYNKMSKSVEEKVKQHYEESEDGDNVFKLKFTDKTKLH